MNYLAHAFLGSHSEAELVGQLIADEIKGNQFERYPRDLAIGIQMHRWIDHTTDESPHLSNIKQTLRPVTGKFTGIALDVIMDHFLSIHWNRYHPLPLSEFISHVYTTLVKYRAHWTPMGTYRLEKMIEQNWLQRYQTLEGIELTMRQMTLRKPILKPLLETQQLIENHKTALDQAFHLLIHDLFVGYKSKINTFATLPPESLYKDGYAK
jgi:acyl carrier protein phosphodiesterase